jgi:hypothetical protein
MRTQNTKEEPAQDRADHATNIIIEAIQEIVSALDLAVHAIMYYMPAKGAEPEASLERLDRVKERFARALYLINQVGQPPSALDLAVTKEIGRFVPASLPKKRNDERRVRRHSPKIWRPTMRPLKPTARR